MTPRDEIEKAYLEGYENGWHDCGGAHGKSPSRAWRESESCRLARSTLSRPAAPEWPVCGCGHSRERHARRVMPGCISVYGECVGCFTEDFKPCECATYAHDGVAPAAPATEAARPDADFARWAEKCVNGPETVRALEGAYGQGWVDCEKQRAPATEAKCGTLGSSKPGVRDTATEYEREMAAWESPTPPPAEGVADAYNAALYCPACGTRHVDEGEWATRRHHKHLCVKCGFLWRVEPYTFGVPPPATPKTGVEAKRCPAPFKLPLRFDAFGNGIIMDGNGVHLFDLRAWGYLTGQLGMSNEVATKAGNGMAEFVVACVNRAAERAERAKGE